MRRWLLSLSICLSACGETASDQSSTDQQSEQAEELAWLQEKAKLAEEQLEAAEQPGDYTVKLKRCYTPQLGEIVRNTFDRPSDYEYDASLTMPVEVDTDGFNTIVSFHHVKDIDGALIRVTESREVSIRPNDCRVQKIRELKSKNEG